MPSTMNIVMVKIKVDLLKHELKKIISRKCKNEVYIGILAMEDLIQEMRAQKDLIIPQIEE